MTLEEMLQDESTPRVALIAIIRELRWQRDELANKYLAAHPPQVSEEAAAEGLTPESALTQMQRSWAEGYDQKAAAIGQNARE